MILSDAVSLVAPQMFPRRDLPTLHMCCDPKTRTTQASSHEDKNDEADAVGTISLLKIFRTVQRSLWSANMCSGLCLMVMVMMMAGSISHIHSDQYDWAWLPHTDSAQVMLHKICSTAFIMLLQLWHSGICSLCFQSCLCYLARHCLQCESMATLLSFSHALTGTKMLTVIYHI